jgi:hypothetical protein
MIKHVRDTPPLDRYINLICSPHDRYIRGVNMPGTNHETDDIFIVISRKKSNEFIPYIRGCYIIDSDTHCHMCMIRILDEPSNYRMIICMKCISTYTRYGITKNIRDIGLVKNWVRFSTLSRLARQWRNDPVLILDVERMNINSMLSIPCQDIINLIYMYLI